jgi:hypothetical protein
MWREKVRESWERSSLFLIFLGKTCLLISYVTGQFPEESVSKTNAHCFGKSTNNISKGFKVYYDFIFSNGMS